MKKFLLIAWISVSCTLFAAAQTPNIYLFEQTTGTYAELSNDTTISPAYFGNDTANDLHMVKMQGQAYSLFEKTFNINDLTHRISFSSAGFMRIEDLFTLIIIDGAFTYLDSIDNNTRLSYVVEGTPGSYVVKAQWKNLRMRYGQPGNFVNFQIWMYQKTGVFEVRYGAIAASNHAGFNDTSGGHAGIFYAPNDFTSMYEKIWIEGTPGNYTIDSARTVNFNTMHGMPNNGTIFRFVPKKVALQVSAIQPDKQVRVYPNPASNELNIQLPVTKNDMRAVLYDMQGRSIRTFDIAAGTASMNVPVWQLPDGIYELKLISAQLNVAYKVEVKH